MIKQIKQIGVSDLNKLAIIFDEFEIKRHGIINGDKLNLDDMLIEHGN